MAAPQAGGGQGTEGHAGILWIIAAIFGILAMIWFAFKKYLVFAYFQLKLWEIDFVSYCLNLLGIYRFNSTIDALKEALAVYVQNGLVTIPTFDNVVNLGAQVGTYLRVPFGVILFILAILVYLGNSTRVFKRTYTMKDMVHLEKSNWPQISIVADLDLVKADIDKGPWAMALTPMQFCKRNKLLEEFKKTTEAVSLKDRDRIEVSLKRGLATKLFALQLGPLWQGLDRLPPHVRALFAAFAARINADSKGAAALLAQLAASATSTLDYSGVNALLNKHVNTKIVQQVMNSHAYVLTVMAAMLRASREDGVQASADFLWIKPIDRRLWYMLNTVGRQTPFVEIAGPYAHWLAEREMGHRILAPMVEEATNALEVALKQMIYRPDTSD